MKIKELTLEGFRNYERAELTFDGGCNVIYGENAQGKTNLLEAIAYMSCGKSPRAHADRELIGFEKDTARLYGVIESRDRGFKTDMILQRGRCAAHSVFLAGGSVFDPRRCGGKAAVYGPFSLPAAAAVCRGAGGV